MATGALERVNVTAGGAGYTSAPAVALNGGGGSGAAATAVVISGAVVAVLLTSPGTAYTSAPSVAFSGGGGSGAAATAVLGLASYASVAQLRAYLPEVPAGASYDGQLQDVLDRATAICNDAVVGLNFAFAGYVAESRPILSTHSPYLILPAHQLGSLSSISLYGTPLVAGKDYSIILETDGVHESVYRSTTQSGPGWWPPPQRDSWGWMGYYYDVVAAWGFGPPPQSAVEICLEVAVNIWQSRKAGRFTNIIGVPGAAGVGYEGALSPLQRSVLAGLKAIFARDVVSV